MSDYDQERYDDLNRREAEYEGGRLIRDTTGMAGWTLAGTMIGGPVGGVIGAVGSGIAAIARKNQRENERDGDD